MHFEAISGEPALTPNLVVKVPASTGDRYLRITHVFDTCIYGIWVKGQTGAKDASRPRKYHFGQLEKFGGMVGKLSIPDELLGNHSTIDNAAIDHLWSLIEPLVSQFNEEENLRHGTFSQMCEVRADNLGLRVNYLKRLLIRYYYFGAQKSALASSKSGPKEKPESTSTSLITSPSVHRRGPQARIATAYGRNDFVLSEDEVNEMVHEGEAWQASGKPLTEFLTKEYLPKLYLRYPALYEQLKARTHPPLVTYRQLTHYVSRHKEHMAAMALATRRPGTDGSLSSLGPGMVYEIDATGGRIELVAKADGKYFLVGRPTIYLLIDRASRYIPAVYISLQKPSWEEARQVLLVAFTDREKRFSALNINVTNERWPPGVVCLEMYTDRGSEFLGDNMEAVLKDLKITPIVLPGATPNGKAIIERFIRTLKQRMGSRLNGAFVVRPLTSEAKEIAAEEALLADLTLADCYREIIEIIIEYNNSVHSALENHPMIKMAGIKPTPQEAYIWGRKNITGLANHSLTDEQIKRKCLTTDTATVTSDGLMFKNHKYMPDNHAAMKVIESTKSRTPIAVRFDRLDPEKIFVQKGWAEFTMSDSDKLALKGHVLDDVLARTGNAALLSDVTRADSVQQSVIKSLEEPAKAPRPRAAAMPHAARRQFQTDESDNVKRALSNVAPQPEAAAAAEETETDEESDAWEAAEAAEQNRIQDEIRKRAKR